MEWIRIMSLYPELAATRDASGWSETTWANLDRKIMACMVETFELTTDLRRETGPWAAELADVATYLIVIIGDLGEKRQRQVPALRSALPEVSIRSLMVDPERVLLPIRSELISAWGCWRLGAWLQDDQAEVSREQVMCALYNALRLTCDLSHVLRIDLPYEVADKMRVNASRPKRHGGKHPDT